MVCEYRVSAERGGPEQAAGRSIRWLRDCMSPRFDPTGKLVGWDGVVTDVTEQRRLAEDLRRTTSLFHVLVTHLPAGIFFIQGPTGRPILVNARARQLLGQKDDPFSDLEHLSFVYRLFRADGTPYPVEELPVYQALKYGRTSMRDDIIVHRPDGQRVPLVSWAAPVRPCERQRAGPLAGEGEPDREEGAVWVMEDLTALHLAENARRETEDRRLERELQHEQRLELVGRVASGVAHDFNNLLTVVLNLCSVSLAELPAGHPTQEHLRLITEASERAATLAGQLLALSRQRIQLRSVDLNVVASRTLDLIRALLPGSITTSLEASPEPVRVRADETQIQQVLLNLCLNARDAMPQGGRLRVILGRSRWPTTTDPCASLVVEDDGAGMSEEVRRSLFQPFFTTKEEGHGLGLSVAQRIVEGYQGRIDVTSEPGRGSRFEVLLPLEPGSQSDH